MNFKEFFIGTTEEQEADQKRNKLSSLGKLNSRKRRQLERATAISRRRFIRLGVTGTAAATAVAIGLHETLKDKNEVNLGQLRFYLQNESEWPSKEKEALFQQMKNAYEKLLSIFGDEMVGGMSGDIPIDLATISARISMQATASFNKNGEVSMHTLSNPHAIMLNAKGEPTIFHELFHFFVQRGYLLPESFMEGHAHALTFMAYGEHYDPHEDTSGESISHLLTYDRMHDILNIGLDFNKFEESYQGGVSPKSLQRLLRSKWELEWASFGETHPSFFQKFYKALRKAVEQDRLPLDKALALQIASSVEPDFANWYDNTPSMHSMNEHPPFSLSEVISIPKIRLLILSNMKTHPAQLNGTEVTPAYLGLNIPHTNYSIVVEDQKGKEREIVINDVRTPFMLFKVPMNYSRIKYVKLGDVDVPVNEASSK